MFMWSRFLLLVALELSQKREAEEERLGEEGEGVGGFFSSRLATSAIGRERISLTWSSLNLTAGAADAVV